MKDLRDARILVTAFEPFEGNPVNASQVAVEGLDGQTIGSSSCQISLGRALKKSSMLTRTS